MITNRSKGKVYKSQEYAIGVWEIRHPEQANAQRRQEFARSEQARINTLVVVCVLITLAFVAGAFLAIAH